MLTLKDCPCKDCAERHINCHSSCERYLSFTEARKAQEEQKCRDGDVFASYVAEKQRKQRKRHYRDNTNKYRHYAGYENE